MTDSFERAASTEGVAAAKTGFRIHFLVYLAVQVFLFLIWLSTPHTGDTLPWFVYPLLGWGIGIVAHYAAVRSFVRSRERRPDA
jgi:hypothetical protein